MFLGFQKLSESLSAKTPTSENKASEHSDEELMALAQRGDHGAFEQLFDRYHGVVRAIAKSIIKSTEDAEDVVQEAFLDVYQNCRAYDPSRGTVRVWISYVARYRSIRKWHHLRRRDWQSEDVETAQPLADPGCTPNQRIRSIDFQKFLSAVLDSLSDKQKRTVVLYFFEGLDVDSIAAHLGESLANTRHHLYRGIARLRRELSKTRLLAGYREYEACPSTAETKMGS
jgi:RNA polymerase sigma-70 factor, ECF subfamily